jgi:hypothetical protein
MGSDRYPSAVGTFVLAHFTQRPSSPEQKIIAKPEFGKVTEYFLPLAHHNETHLPKIRTLKKNINET